MTENHLSNSPVEFVDGSTKELEPKSRKEYFLNKIAKAISRESDDDDGGSTQKRTLYIALYGSGEYPEHPGVPSDLPDTGDPELVWGVDISQLYGIFDENKTPLTYEEIKDIDVYNTIFKYIDESDEFDTILFPAYKTQFESQSETVSLVCFYKENTIAAGVSYIAEQQPVVENPPIVDNPGDGK